MLGISMPALCRNAVFGRGRYISVVPGNGSDFYFRGS
jgi:hypothetical protein